MLSITYSYSIYYRSQIYIHTHTLQLCSKFPLTGKGNTHNNLCISQDLGLQRAEFFSSFQSAVRAVLRRALLLQEVLLASMAERNTLAQGSEQGEHSDEHSDTRTGSIPGRHYFLPSLCTLVFRTDSLLLFFLNSRQITSLEFFHWHWKNLEEIQNLLYCIYTLQDKPSLASNASLSQTFFYPAVLSLNSPQRTGALEV